MVYRFSYIISLPDVTSGDKKGIYGAYPTRSRAVGTYCIYQAVKAQVSLGK